MSLKNNITLEKYHTILKVLIVSGKLTIDDVLFYWLYHKNIKSNYVIVIVFIEKSRPTIITLLNPLNSNLEKYQRKLFLDFTYSI